MSATKRPHHRFKPVLIPAISEVRGTIRYGLAIIPYDEHKDCWLLPAGPNQTNRFVKDPTVARDFAIRLNDILNHYPQLAVRLQEHKAA